MNSKLTITEELLEIKKMMQELEIYEKKVEKLKAELRKRIQK